MRAAYAAHRHRTAADGTQEKQCTKCGEWWAATDQFFHKARRNALGLHSWCKACVNERVAARRRARP